MTHSSLPEVYRMKPLPFPANGRLAGILFCGTILALAASSILLAGEERSKPATAPTANEAKRGGVLTPNSVQDSFDFDTDQMQGTIRLDGAYHGVTRLVDKHTGRQVIDSRYSALNLFKLMSVNQAMDQPRNMERTTRVASDWIEVEWAATDTHQAQITARYEVPEPNAVDVTVTVRSRGTYRGYELFMSSYFDKVMRPQVYLQSRSAGPELVVPTVNDVFRGTVLVFPRDAHSARPCLDGRWDRNERSTPTVQMCPVRRYAHCLGFLTDPDEQVGVVLMSHPRDCYAISTRYYAEDDADRLTTYSAFDLSLFGDDLLPGVERSVKVRLALVRLDGDLSRPLECYRAFIGERDEQLDQPHTPDSKGTIQ